MSDDSSATQDEGEMKRWLSEPTLLGDYDEEWLNGDINTPEESSPFTDEVFVQQNLRHVTKERVQFRPKRRPPSRDFIKSRASIDFDFAIPEKITEEEECEGSTQRNEDAGASEQPPAESSKQPPPVPPPKPREPNAFKLPTFDANVVLKKTPSSESKRSEFAKQDSVATTGSETSDDSVDVQQGSPSKQKKRRRIKLKLFGNRQSRKAKEAARTTSAPETGDTNGNLRKCASVDSGARPLGSETRQRHWLHRRVRQKSNERRNLNWLLGIFQRKNSSSSHDGHAPQTVQLNGTSLDRSDHEASGDPTTTDAKECDDEEENEQRHESVSDLKKRFERGKV